MSTDQQATNPACGREHADEWVEVDGSVAADLPRDVRVRHEWVLGDVTIPPLPRYFVHRADLPDPDAEKIERMAKAILKADSPNAEWEDLHKVVQEDYLKAARAALAAYREEER